MSRVERDPEREGQAGNPEVAYEMGHTVGVLTSTYAHMIAEFRGGGQIDPEMTVQAARGRLSSIEQAG